MDIQQVTITLINNFTATLVAIITLAGIIGKIKPIGNSIKRFFFFELYAANEKQDKRLDNLEMQQLKQIICDRRLPVGDRLNAGDEYIGRGGNGEIKVIYESLKEVAKKKQIEQEEREKRRKL
jgi:hypothetical protein